MFLKFGYRLGYESLCADVAGSISWRRLCRIPLDGRVPHPATLMKLTSRCGEDAMAGLNEALWAKASVANETAKPRLIVPVAGKVPAHADWRRRRREEG